MIKLADIPTLKVKDVDGLCDDFYLVGRES